MSDFSKARVEMVEGQLRPSGVFDARVLAAFGKVPREVFLSDEQKPFAYAEMDHELSKNPLRFMGAPAPVARLVELGEPGADDVVLHIGSANGYVSAVLAQLAGSVVGLENSQELISQGDEILSDLDIPNAAIIKGRLEYGAPSEAPFDLIIIEGAVAKVPQKLFEQLRIGGKLVALIGYGASATAVLHTKSETGIARIKSFNACLPELKEFAMPVKFAL